MLDGEVVSAPTINGPIYGTTQITGQFSQAEAQDLAGVLRYGSLPLSFESSEAQTVSATLGLASLQAGLIAGGIGLALVFVYCLFYYRVLGVLTILSLVLSGAGRLRRAGAARALDRLHARPRRHRRVHRRHRHHGGLVRDLLRTAQGRGPRGPHASAPRCRGRGFGPGARSCPPTP